MVKLFVVGFPREMGDIELDQLFSNEALVRKVTIIRDMQTGVSKGYAFVEMMDKIGAERAIRSLNGLTIGGRTISVRLADNKTASPPKATDPPDNGFKKSRPRRGEINARFQRPRKPRNPSS